MIVGSLLLILVAVALLVFGLAGGSSLLLISSIVASLLAAVALVVGARQAAARSVRAAPVPDSTAGDPPGAASPRPAAPSGATFDPGASFADAPSGGGFVPGARAGEPADAAYSYAGEPAGQGAQVFTGQGTGGHPTTYARDPEPAEEPAPPLAASTFAGATGWSAVPEQAGPSDAEPGGARAFPGADSEHEPADDSLAEPDPEDPADEPRAQWVAPADAAQLAVTTIEVLVVDGRPRYHVTGCPHLSGRETEALPVAEAIDLGFTPCGICRPVDRLLATARPH
jgi:hypothetical protein